MRIGEALYFDHQATTPVDASVFDKMAPFFGESFGNPHSGDHAFGWRAAAAIEQATAEVARLVGADTDEVVFTSGATEANNLAIIGLATARKNSSRQRILVSEIEHKSILACAEYLRWEHKIKIDYIPVDKEGIVDLGFIEDTLDDDVLAISVLAVNNEIGTIQPLDQIAALAQRIGAFLHCDAAQAPCAMTTNLLARHADLVSLSAHKMYGPSGIGALVARRALHSAIDPSIHGGGQQNDLRSGTLPAPLCVGMGAAAALCASDEAEADRQNTVKLRDRFVTGLKRLDYPITVNGPANGRRHPGNANICFLSIPANELLGALQPRLAASTGSACTSGIQEPSHVLRAIGLSKDEAQASIRFSIGRRTIQADVDDAVALIKSALDRLSAAGLIDPDPKYRK